MVVGSFALMFESFWGGVKLRREGRRVQFYLVKAVH